MPGDVLSSSTKTCFLDISSSASNSSVCRCLNRQVVTDHFSGVFLSPTSRTKFVVDHSFFDIPQNMYNTDMVTLHPHRGRVSQIE
eukprot:3599291-Ditylum_brightwellii.AAC.1